jgi:hypothetical protein
MLIRAILAIGLVLVVPVHAVADSEKKVWACAAVGSTSEDLFLVEWGSRSYVKLYDVRLWGNYDKEGAERRWDFGQGRGGKLEYSVVLKDDGDLDYYDFRNVKIGDEVAPAYHYRCRLAQS